MSCLARSTDNRPLVVQRSRRVLEPGAPFACFFQCRHGDSSSSATFFESSHSQAKPSAFATGDPLDFDATRFTVDRQRPPLKEEDIANGLRINREGASGARV